MSVIISTVQHLAQWQLLVTWLKTAMYLVASIWNYPDHKLKQIFFPKNICILQILYLFFKDLLSACCKKNSPVEIQNWTPTWPRFISQIRGPQVFLRRRQWHPTLVLLPGKFHGLRSLVGCSPWGRKESDTTEQLHFHFSLSYIGEGNGNPLQCSCLENPRDGEPGGLPSMGLHRVGHDWSNLAAAAAASLSKN